MGGKLVFITGGARSGKSSFALAEAARQGGGKAFIATARPSDSEMTERIKRHRDDRGDLCDTYEEPLRVADVIRSIEDKYDVVIIDCLTIWLANLLFSNADVEGEIGVLVECLKNVSHPMSIYIVSNEVGMGIVPDNEMARRYRDLAGFLNQRVAGIADEVFLLVSGMPVKIKGGS